MRTHLAASVALALLGASTAGAGSYGTYYSYDSGYLYTNGYGWTQYGSSYRDDPRNYSAVEGVDFGSYSGATPGPGGPNGPGLGSDGFGDTGLPQFGRAEGGCASTQIAGAWAALGVLGVLTTWSRLRHASGPQRG